MFNFQGKWVIFGTVFAKNDEIVIDMFFGYCFFVLGSAFSTAIILRQTLTV